MQNQKIVSRAEWLEARKKLLAMEKEATRQRDAVSAERRKLPWVKMEKRYEFEGPKGKETLSDLFEGRSQLIIYHFMFSPDWVAGCPSCSFVCDHIDGALPHLNARDVTLVVVSRAPYEKIAAFKKRMGWRFKWVSSFGSDFNFDYRVSFTPEQIAEKKTDYNFGTIDFEIEDAPGTSVFYKDKAGEVFHTYSTFARGLDLQMSTYNYLDLVPKGRDEDGLAFSMAWVRYHDQYDENYKVDPKAGYQKPASDKSCCHS